MDDEHPRRGGPGLRHRCELDRSRDRTRGPVIALEDRNQVLGTQGEDFAEGILAFLEKRTCRYTGR